MEIKKLQYDLTVCKVKTEKDINFTMDFSLIGIVSKVSSILADKALAVLEAEGYKIV